MKKLLKLIDDFFNPPFTVEDIRSCKIRCNLSFVTTEHIWVKNDKYMYDFPSMACGIVKTKRGHYIQASWDSKGHCMVEGNRIKSFDFVRANQKEKDFQNILFVCGSIAILCFFGYVIYKMLS